MSRGTLDPALSAFLSCTGLSPSLAAPSQKRSIRIAESIMRSEPRNARIPVWPLSISLAATLEIEFSFFSSPYLDVSVQAVPHAWLWIHHTLAEVCSAGFPHSEISGSMDICSSPKLFAAYHVFHRLLVPRHPPCALSSLTNFYTLHSVAGVGSGCLCSQTVHLSMLLFLLGCLVSIFCVRYLCILLYAIFKVQRNRCKI